MALSNEASVNGDGGRAVLLRLAGGGPPSTDRTGCGDSGSLALSTSPELYTVSTTVYQDSGTSCPGVSCDVPGVGELDRLALTWDSKSQGVPWPDGTEISRSTGSVLVRSSRGRGGRSSEEYPGVRGIPGDRSRGGVPGGVWAPLALVTVDSGTVGMTKDRTCSRWHSGDVAVSVDCDISNRPCGALLWPARREALVDWPSAWLEALECTGGDPGTGEAAGLDCGSLLLEAGLAGEGLGETDELSRDDLRRRVGDLERRPGDRSGDEMVRRSFRRRDGLRRDGLSPVRSLRHDRRGDLSAEDVRPAVERCTSGGCLLRLLEDFFPVIALRTHYAVEKGERALC